MKWDSQKKRLERREQNEKCLNEKLKLAWYCATENELPNYTSQVQGSSQASDFSSADKLTFRRFLFLSSIEAKFCCVLEDCWRRMREKRSCCNAIFIVRAVPTVVWGWLGRSTSKRMGNCGKELKNLWNWRKIISSLKLTRF